MILVLIWLAINALFCGLAILHSEGTGAKVIGLIWSALHVACLIYLWKV